jgi:hypothetical protein
MKSKIDTLIIVCFVGLSLVGFFKSQYLLATYSLIMAMFFMQIVNYLEKK